MNLSPTTGALILGLLGLLTGLWLGWIAGDSARRGRQSR